jgi:hypothetical protein
VTATDAGANDTTATIGGWYHPGTCPQKHQVHWFCTPITKDTHPWAFHKNTPQQQISKIELYATLCLYKSLAYNNQNVTVTIPMTTDNCSNAYKIFNYKTRLADSKNKRKHAANQSHCTATASMLVEIALIQQATSTVPTLGHAYREHNTWADHFTHRDFDGFSEQNRFTPDGSCCLILDELTQTTTNTKHPP